MARVACFEIPGIECVFYSHDHGPPHFHAIRAGTWEYRVYFQAEVTLEKKWSKRRLSGHDARALRESAESHRAQLLEEWEDIHG